MRVLHRYQFVAVVAGLTVAGGAKSALALDHGAFDKILRTYVKSGRVDYAGIKAKAKAELDAYVAAIGKKGALGGSKTAKLAAHLNAYNALVIKAVVDRYPLVSVMKVKGFFDKIRHQVDGRSLTLNDLEKKRILAIFKDPRVHFALVCGAKSCPPLQSSAFKASTVNKVLDKLASRFINSSAGVRVSGAKITVSKIFEWYQGDFAAKMGSVGAYLAHYHKAAADRLKASKSFAYMPYSWNLNKR